MSATGKISAGLFAVTLILLVYTSCESSFLGVSVNGVSVSPTVASLTVGDTEQLTATISPTEATNTAVSWTSSDDTVASVSEDGLVTAVAEGSATITVITDDGGFAATATIDIAEAVVSVNGVSVSPTVASLTVGDTEQLTATISPTDATNKAVSWASSDNTVASVSEDGLVTAVAEGSATITVTTDDGNFTTTATIDVAEAVVSVNGVSVSPTVASLTVGDTEQLTATISPTDATNKALSWASSDNTVASVSEDGLVTAVAEGSATITVTSDDGDFTSTTAVEIAPMPTGIMKVENNSVYNLEVYVNDAFVGVLQSGYYTELTLAPQIYKVYFQNAMYAQYYGPDYWLVLSNQTRTYTLYNYYVPQYTSIASYITSSFDGLQYGNTYTLANGQIWQQTEYYYWYHYAFYPDVEIYQYLGQYYMKVEGIDYSVQVHRIQ